MTRPTIPDYELVRPIGRGGYGEVWLARGLTGAWRAVKVVWRNRFSDTEPYEREFRGLKEMMALPLAEAGALALHHVGRDEGGEFFYYVMELADDAATGRTVDPERYVPLTLKQLRTQRGRLPAREVIELGAVLARGLAALHARGLVHRDIKPSNVVLVNGAPKLADIGLVAASSSAHTFVGTEGFVPPEGPGTPAADVFALGRVLYELATGNDRQDYPKLPERFVDAADRAAFFRLNEVLLRACDRDPARRYGDAPALLADLERQRAGATVSRQPAAWAALGAVATILLAAGVWIVTGVREPSPVRRAMESVAPTPAKSGALGVVVLPLANASGDPEQDYLAEAMTSELLSALARDPALRVPGRASAFAFKGRNVQAAEIGRALNVEWLIEGRVRRAENRVRVELQMRRTAGGTIEPVGTFEREVRELFALQEEVARGLTLKLTNRLPPAARAASISVPSAEAYDAYLRGRKLQVTSAARAPEAERWFERAVELEPTFARAWAELAATRLRQVVLTPGRKDELFAAAKPAIDRALELDPGLAEALIARADWRRLAPRDFAGAASDLATAETLEPPTANLRRAQSMLAIIRDDWPQVFRRIDQALALDPQDGDLVNASGLTLEMRGKFVEADALFARAVALQAPVPTPFLNRLDLRDRWRGPEAAARLLARAPAGVTVSESWRMVWLAAQGKRTEARALAEQVEAEADRLAAAGDLEGARRKRVPALFLEEIGWTERMRARAEEEHRRARQRYQMGDRAPQTIALLARLEIMLGNRTVAVERLAELRAKAETQPGSYSRFSTCDRNLAAGYALLGMADEALAILERNAADGFRGLTLGGRSHVWEPIRGDPKFRAFHERERAWAAALPDPEDEPAQAGVEAGANISRPQAAAEMAVVAASEAPKSLVVLPLENLSPDPADADFADGMHAEIVAALSRNGELRVLSRSTGQALTKAGASTSALVSRLNIAHTLSGTVWRHGPAVRISVELRRTTDNASIWQNRYERAFVDGFALQDEIAADVAKFLQAHRSSGWYAGAKFMTRNVAAYQLFLRARDVTVRKGATRAAMAEQAELAEAALALDPEFMSAASLAASAYCYLYVNAPDGPAGRELAAKARHWAERAAQLVPGGAGEGALSVYYSLVERDSERAFVHAQNEVRALPNDANGHNRVATGLRAQGRLQEAVASYERALELDPLSARVLLNRVSLFGQLRRRPEFEAAVTACLELGGEHLNRAVIADFRFRLTGELPDNLENLDGQTFSGRLRMLWYGRRFEEMLQAAREEIAGLGKLVPARQIDALRAEVLATKALGREDEFSRAARRFGDEVRRRIGRGDFSAGYGEAIEAEAAQYAGEEERAVLLLRRLIGAAKPAQVNLRWGYEEALAGVYAWFGRGDECVALLERLVAVPSGITVPLLEREPKWDPVRNHPGFRALVATPKNAEPL